MYAEIWPLVYAQTGNLRTMRYAFKLKIKCFNKQKPDTLDTATLKRYSTYLRRDSRSLPLQFERQL